MLQKGISAIKLANRTINVMNILDHSLLSTNNKTNMQKLIMFVRHGPRYPSYIIKDMDLIEHDINNVPLTEKGIEYAFLFGRYLGHVYGKKITFKHNKTKIYTSDKIRTYQTANQIYRGLFDENISCERFESSNLFIGKDFKNKMKARKDISIKSLFSENDLIFNTLLFKINSLFISKKRKLDQTDENKNIFTGINTAHDLFELYGTICYLEKENKLYDKYIITENGNKLSWDETDTIRLKLCVQQYMNFMLEDKDIMKMMINDLISIIYNDQYINSNDDRYVNTENNTDLTHNNKNFVMVCIHDWQIYALAKYFVKDKKIKLPDYCLNVRLELYNRRCYIYYDDILLADKDIYQVLNS